MTTRQIAIEGASVRKSSVSSFSSRDENFAPCDPPPPFRSSRPQRIVESHLGERCASDPREISFRNRITRCLDLLIAEQGDCTRVLALARGAPPAARLPRVVALIGRRYYRFHAESPICPRRLRDSVARFPGGLAAVFLGTSGAPVQRVSRLSPDRRPIVTRREYIAFPIAINIVLSTKRKDHSKP